MSIVSKNHENVLNEGRIIMHQNLPYETDRTISFEKEMPRKLTFENNFHNRGHRWGGQEVGEYSVETMQRHDIAH
jgi:hypothetical protein